MGGLPIHLRHMLSTPARLGAALAALVALAAPALAQDVLPPHAGLHVLTLAPDGTLACDAASEAQGLALADRRVAPEAVQLTPLPSLNAEAALSDFRIVLRATNQLLAQPEVLLAFRRAAARWERILRSDVTIVIDVDYGPERFGEPYPSNVLGSTASYNFSNVTENLAPGPGAGDIVARLKQHATDPQLTALYDAIPLPTPSTSIQGELNRGLLGFVTLQVLGYAAADASTNLPFGRVSSIGFNDILPYDFDPTDGIASNRFDFEGTALHEIGHALGFTSAVGFSLTGSNPLFSPWDLFRVRPEDVEPGESLTDGAGFEVAPRVVTPGPPTTEVLTTENGVTYYQPVQVFFDGLGEYEVATGTSTGGDGFQASHWRDDALRPPSLGADRKVGIMDPNIGPGTRDEITYADIRVLDVLGFEVDYDPPTATVALSVAGQAVDDLFVVADTVSVGDAPSGTTFSVPVVVGNLDTATALEYAVEVELTDLFPLTSVPQLSLTQPAGTVAPGGSVTLQLRIDATDQSIGAGVLRLRTNDEVRPVIEVPFQFTVGGAAFPELVVANVPVSLGDLDVGETKTTTLPISNAGTFDLDYRVLSTLVEVGLEFPETSAGSPTSSRTAAPVFSADFEGAGALAGFGYNVKAAPDRWQLRTSGPASLPGHSSPTALYYGSAGGANTYSDNSSGQITLPPLDFSGTAPGSRVTFSFAYYLQAEAGFDFATALVSFDGGDSYEAIATSDGGALLNTDAWERVTVEIPGVAGFPEPILFAFRFSSDASVNDVGWFIDDVVVDVAAGEAPFFVTPVAGTLPGGGSAALTLTADASVLEPGFYRASVEFRTDQPGPDPAPYLIDFTVGAPALPGVQPVDASPLYSVEGGRESVVRLDARNAGDATLSFVRVLEPATGRFEAGGRHATAAVAPPAGSPEITPEAARSEAAPPPDGDVLAAASFGTTRRFFDVGQYPDGRIVAVDGSSNLTATAIVLPRDLSDPGETFSSQAFDARVTGVAYNDHTESLWFALFETATLAEVVLENGAVVPTGRAVDLDFTPFGMDYSPELDAFLIGSFDGGSVLAVSAEGELLTGYPAFVVGRDLDDGATGQPGVTVTRGLLEATGRQNELLLRDQFGAPFGATGGTFSAEVLGGSTGIYALQRDRLDPDGSFFVTTRPEPAGTPTRVVRIDPPDVPAAVAPTRIRGAQPLFADRSIEPQAPFSLFLAIDATDLAPGETTEDLTFLTNDPVTPVDRIPVRLSVTPVAAEDAVAGAFAVAGVRPNPARGTARVAFTLPSAADVTAAVYDALGRRVAVLAERRPLAAGSHALDVPTSALAPGVYVVRVEAGPDGGAAKLTVIR